MRCRFLFDSYNTQINFQSNGTDLGEMTTSRGNMNYKDLGRLLKVKGEEGTKNVLIV